MIPRQMIPLESITFKREAAGTWENGDWVRGGVTEFTTNCSVQPQARPSSYMLVAEGDRTKHLIELYSDVFISDGSGEIGPDTFSWQGEEYKVMKAINWSVTRLAHFMVVAARVEHSQ